MLVAIRSETMTLSSPEPTDLQGHYKVLAKQKTCNYFSDIV